MTDTMYNTGNAVPSADPKDRWDNSIVLDRVLDDQGDTVLNRKGKSIYTMAYFNRIVTDAKNRVNVIVADVNDAAVSAKNSMEQTAANLGADMNNKRYDTKALMTADPQTREAVVAVVDNDPDPINNGWYSWKNTDPKGWVLFADQPAMISRVSVTEVAAAALAPVTDMTIPAVFSGTVSNGGSLITRAFRSVGFEIAAGQTGHASFVRAMFPIVNVPADKLSGCTVQAVITGRYTGDFGSSIKLNPARGFQSVVGGSTVNVGRMISESYANGIYRRVIEHVVTPQDTQLGILLATQVGPAATVKSSIIIDRVSFGIVSASEQVTQFNTEEFNRERSASEAHALTGLSWRWAPSAINSGYANLNNGAVSLPAGAAAPAISGIRIPGGKSGGDTVFYNVHRPAPELVKELAGSTVRFVLECDASAGFVNLVDIGATAGMRAARGAASGTSEVTAKLVGIYQDGATIRKIVDYVVDATDTQWAISMSIFGSSPIQAVDVQADFKSLNWSVVAGTQSKRASDYAFAARQAEAAAGTDAKIEKALITSGNVSNKLATTGAPDVNGAVMALGPNGEIIGFDIPAGKSGTGAYCRFMVPYTPDQVAAIVGQRVRFVLELDVSATWQADKPLRQDRAVYVEGVGNVGALVSESYTGTRLVRVVEYTVAAGATKFGPVISMIGTAVSTNDNSLRLRGVRWSVGESNTPGIKANDWILDQRLQAIESAIPVDGASTNHARTVRVIGEETETVSVAGLTATIQAYTVERASADLKTQPVAVTFDAPATDAVVDHPFTLIAGTDTALAPGERLPHQYSSNRVVKRVSDGATLVEGIDFAVKPGTCYIYGIKAIANEACTITYTGHHHRYDIVALNPATGAISVTKGGSRSIDPEEYKASLPAGLILLNEVYVYQFGVDVLQSWRFHAGRDNLAGQSFDEWLSYSRAMLPKTMAKLRRGQKIRLIGYGSSSVDMGMGSTSPLVPNVARDMQIFFDRIPADTRAKYPQYGSSDPDFSWSTRSDHIKYGFMWKLIGAMRDRWDADVEYRNWGVGGTNSSDTKVGNIPNGAHPERLNAMLADDGDLMVLAFANGLGASYWYSSHRTIIEAFKARGGEVIVLTSPRLNSYGKVAPDDIIWKKSYDDSIQVALDTGCAYVPTWLMEGPGVEGNCGLSTRNMSNSNLLNHGGPIQLGKTGDLMAMIIP